MTPAYSTDSSSWAHEPAVVREDTIESGFIVSNRDRTYDAANNKARHLAFNADTAMRDSAMHPREASPRSLSGGVQQVPGRLRRGKHQHRRLLSEDCMISLAA
jgi:hypothetical protein